MTERELNLRGYRLTRGAYIGTLDDRIDRWYIDDTHSTVVDRRGEGYRTKRDALEAAGDIMDPEFVPGGWFQRWADQEAAEAPGPDGGRH